MIATANATSEVKKPRSLRTLLELLPSRLHGCETIHSGAGGVPRLKPASHKHYGSRHHTKPCVTSLAHNKPNTRQKGLHHQVGDNTTASCTTKIQCRRGGYNRWMRQWFAANCVVLLMTQCLSLDDCIVFSIVSMKAVGHAWLLWIETEEASGGVLPSSPTCPFLALLGRSLPARCSLVFTGPWPRMNSRIHRLATRARQARPSMWYVHRKSERMQHNGVPVWLPISLCLRNTDARCAYTGARHVFSNKLFEQGQWRGTTRSQEPKRIWRTFLRILHREDDKSNP